MSIQPFSVNIIGSGNLAWHLSLALHKAGNNIRQVISRNKVEGKRLADKISSSFSDDFNNLPEADFILICVSDDAIFTLAEKLPETKSVVLHTAGAISIKALEKFEKHGVFYPLQTFNKYREIDFSDIPVCIEANQSPVLEKTENLARTISGNIQRMDSGTRKAVHLSAVFANNFTNHLVGIAEEILKENQVSPEILFPILKETFEKIKAKGASHSQTGPALRGDEKTMANHLEMLQESPLRKEIYLLISKAIRKA